MIEEPLPLTGEERSALGLGCASCLGWIAGPWLLAIAVLVVLVVHHEIVALAAVISLAGLLALSLAWVGSVFTLVNGLMLGIDGMRRDDPRLFSRSAVIALLAAAHGGIALASVLLGCWVCLR